LEFLIGLGLEIRSLDLGALSFGLAKNGLVCITESGHTEQQFL